MTLDDQQGENPAHNPEITGDAKPTPKRKKTARKKSARKKVAADKPIEDRTVTEPVSQETSVARDTRPEGEERGRPRGGRRPPRRPTSQREEVETDHHERSFREPRNTSAPESDQADSEEPHSSAPPSGGSEKSTRPGPSNQTSSSHHPDQDHEGVTRDQTRGQDQRGHDRGGQDPRKGTNYGYLTAKIRKIMRNLAWAMDDLKETLTLLESAEKEKLLREEEIVALKKQLNQILPSDESREPRGFPRNQPQPKRRFRGPRNERNPSPASARPNRPNSGPHSNPQNQGSRPHSNTDSSHSASGQESD